MPGILHNKCTSKCFKAFGRTQTSRLGHNFHQYMGWFDLSPNRAPVRIMFLEYFNFVVYEKFRLDLNNIDRDIGNDAVT